MELSLAQLFGENSAQNNQTLIIQKSDVFLSSPNSIKTAESLLVAILVNAFRHFSGELTEPSGNKITDSQGRTITYNNSVLYENLKIERWESFIKQSNEQYFVCDQFVIHSESIADYVDT
ncbi:hypothetical protein ACQFX9_25830 [Aliinostoc sp. HNIBRCY26]|uniref:hypothetical protein n=1 Tax=Aliinostoc sp. HNIBRCY26 TaxID=3418997 RepID=UPI003D01D12F